MEALAAPVAFPGRSAASRRTTRLAAAARLVLATLALILSATTVVAGDPPAVTASPAEERQTQERFLTHARIVASRPAPKGVTGSRRVTLSDGVITHDAHVQTIDQFEREFRGRTYVELNFQDSWRYNVAAYRLSVLLGLDMVPVTVERPYQGRPAAFTWWVDDVAMDEGARVKNGVKPPDRRAWHQQMAMVRVFDQLIYNTDRNLGNLLITSDWRVWMIDHTRAFRRHRALRTDMAVRGCDRHVLMRLAALDEALLREQLSRHLDSAEIRALLVRRDAIVSLLREAPAATLFDR